MFLHGGDPTPSLKCSVPEILSFFFEFWKQKLVFKLSKKCFEGSEGAFYVIFVPSIRI